MKIFLDCLPCMLRQILEASYMATDDVNVQEEIMDEALEILADYRNYCCAPQVSEAMHSIVKQKTGVEDPYHGIKSRDISEALRLEPLIREFGLKEQGSIVDALKASATGNIMDSALFNNLDIESCIRAELERPFKTCDIEGFVRDLKEVRQILVIGDNAGEVVFDKILVEYLSQEYDVVYAVRGSAIINDATTEDAEKAGMGDHAKIISTGCGAPGAILSSCSNEFRTIFENVDIVISKGQGNFEALSDTTRDIYFLLKAKCNRIAKTLDVEVNDYVFKKNRIDG